MNELTNTEIIRLKQDRLRASDLIRFFDCDLTSGLLRWKARDFRLFSSIGGAKSWNAKYPSRAAGHSDRLGYVRVKVFGRVYHCHRIILAINTGYWPEIVDHVNGDPSDNRISNLRDVSQGDNTRNARLRSDNTSGICGVAFRPEVNKWGAQIWAHGKHYYLGSFDTAEAAKAARMKAASKFGFHENHGRN